jgi:outer membrane immunogenic protein
MKKVILRIITIKLLCCGVLNANSTPDYNWQGLYFGANAGYWWSPNRINTAGTPAFVSILFPEGSSAISNALATVGTNNFSNNTNGAIGGGQAGYNHLFKNKFLVGIDIGLGSGNQSQSSPVEKTIPVPDFPETYYYSSSITIKQSIDWLGTLQAKLGFLLRPSLTVYGLGGLAFGGLSLQHSLTANESLGPDSYPTARAQQNLNKTRAGWVAGVGTQWMFRPHWSTKIEYSYYDLGTLSGNMNLNQMANIGVSPILWGSARIATASQFTAQAVRIGLNYHFA